MKQYRHPLNPLPIGLVTLSVLLSACGGGGGSEPEAAVQNTSSTSAASVTESDSTSAPAQSSAGASASWSDVIASTATALSQTTDSVPEPEPHAKAAATATIQSTVNYSPSFAGKAYYVSSVSGNDANAGTSDAPWRTLTRASQAKLNSGDALLLRCDGSWAETPVFGSTFAPQGQVLIGAYGSCANGRKPEIRGSTPVPAAQWQLLSSTASGSIYSTTIAGPIAGVFHNARPMVKARHPNLVSLNNNFASAQSGTAGSTVVVSAADKATFAGKDLSGAGVGLRSAAYMIEQGELAGYDSATGTATLKAAPSASLHAGIGYFLEGKRWMLDAPNEWLYEPATQTLLVFVASGDSVSNVFETTAPRTTLTVKGIPGVRVENLNIVNAGEDGLQLVDSGSSKVTAVDVSYARSTGINVSAPKGLASGQGVRVESSQVSDAGITGIGSAVSDTQLVGNIVTNTGTTILGALRPTSGIRISQARNVVVSGNAVRRSGYSGILFANYDGISVRDNYIEDSCLVLSDCGAIYSWGVNSSGNRAQVANNHINRTSNPNLNGTGNNPSSGAPALLAAIYLDEGSNNIDVVGNHISDAYVGINLHKAKSNSLLRNQIYGVREAGLRIQSSGADPQSVIGNRIEDNTIFAPVFFLKGADGTPVSVGGTVQLWIHQGDASAMFSTSANNTLARNTAIHMSEDGALRWVVRSAGVDMVYNSKTWTTRAATDGVRSPYRASIATVQGTQLLGNPLMQAATVPWSAYSYQSGATITAFGTQASCDATCASLTSKTSNDVLQQTAVPTNAADPDLMFVRYRVHAADKATSAKFEVRSNATPYPSAGYLESAVPLAANSRLAREAFFVRNTKSELRLSVKATVDAPLLIDSVELYQVTGFQLPSPLGYGKLVANRSSQAASFSCEALGLSNCNIVDERGAALGWPLTVAAQSARMVFVKDSSWVLN